MPFTTHTQELSTLAQLGFPINPYNKNAKSLKEVWEISQSLNKEKDDLPYPIDGLVVKLNGTDLVERLGVVGKTPRGWCAIKFQAEEVTTRILGVTWQVGRTGKVTPVAELEPVELAGTTVKRASLHNYKEFLEKDLHFHDTLVVRKAGEIIPEVVSVLYNLRPNDSQTGFPFPDQCPSCRTSLVTSNTEVDLMCPNTEGCSAQIIGRLSYFTQRNLGNITGLSEKQLEKFIEKFGISDIPDIYQLPFVEIAEMEGFGAKSVENLQESVEKSRIIEGYKFLAGLGLEGVGPEVAKLICEKLEENEENEIFES